MDYSWAVAAAATTFPLLFAYFANEVAVNHQQGEQFIVRCTEMKTLVFFGEKKSNAL